MVRTAAMCRNFASAPFTIITYDRTVQYGSPEHLTSLNQSSNAAAAPASERRSSRWDVQPVRHVRPGMSSRRQPVESAVPSAPQQEVAGAQATLASQKLHPQPSATGTAAVGRDDDSDMAAQSAAELSALRRRAMQSVPRHNTHEPASWERYRRRPRAASRSPVSQSGKRRRGHHLTGPSAAEPLHRKRHARRHSRTQDSELDTRLAAPVATAVTGGDSDSADSERWVMG
jgi:hypothetical protein